MADPITIISTAGALANVIDVLAKVIGTVSEYRRMWQEADLAALNLESQLAALSTALNKIKAWADSSFQVPHHQLAMDLDRCVLCCRTLIGKIDVEVSQFQVTAKNRLDVASKFRLLLKTRDFENVQRMIEQQTGALTLLLVACNTWVLLKLSVFRRVLSSAKLCLGPCYRNKRGSWSSHKLARSSGRCKTTPRLCMSTGTWTLWLQLPPLR